MRLSSTSAGQGPFLLFLLLSAVVFCFSAAGALAHPPIPEGAPQEEAQPEKKDEKKKDDDGKWDVSEAHGPARTIRFTTSEATWTSVDVSPDGKTLVFDHLGDLFSIPRAGGKATRLTSGRAWDYQPRWSPDGTEILFTSDRGGIDNLWICKANGSNPKAFTKEKDKVMNCGAWSPDGQYIVGKRRLTDTSSIGTTELWIYHRSGGSGIQVTKKDALPEVSEPMFHPDGRFLYFSCRTTRFGYDRDVHDGIYQIRRYDRKTGDVSRVAAGVGGASRPVLSPDGKSMAFINRQGLETALVVRELETGAQRTVTQGLTHDLQESFAWSGTYPSFDWTPDSKSIVLGAQGGLHEIDVDDGSWSRIPFSVDVELEAEEAVRFKPDVTGDTVRLRILRWIHQNPRDGSLVFSALGRLYRADANGGNVRLLLKNDDDSTLEYAPRFSPDGKSIAYVSWNDEERGHVMRVSARGGRGKQLTRIPGQYVNPSWSTDNKQIVYIKGSGATLRGSDLGAEAWLEIQRMDAGGSDPIYVTSLASRGTARRMPSPTFSQDGSRIYYLEDGSSNKSLFKSVTLDGTDRRTHLEIPYGEEVALSPNNQWVAYKHLHDVYVAAFPTVTTEAVSVTNSDGGLTVKRLSNEGADWLHWVDDETVTWGSGYTFYRQTRTRIFAEPEEKKDDEQPEEDAASEDGADEEEEEEEKPFLAMEDEEKDGAPERIEIVLEVPRVKPQGTLVLDGARIITMRGDEVIDNGRIVVEGNRIADVGAAGSVSVPAGAEVIDAGGMTIMPGMVDAHAHMGYGVMDVFPQREWRYYANLAYGVTTTMDPSASTHVVFGQGEMVEAGVMKGPRIYSTGFILYGADIPGKAPTNSLEDARHHMRRIKKRGGFAVKSYMQPRREQRQWYIKAAREEEMLVFPEGGGKYEENLGMILDGHTGIEHSIPVEPLYQDVIEFWSQTDVGYTPTLLVAYGGLSGEHYFYQHSDPPVWANPKMRRFVPGNILDSRSRRLPVMAYEGDWHHINVAASAAKVVRAGGRVQVGAHGQLQGLGAHWELWSLGLGGMSPHEALRCATATGAWYIGLESELGTLENGKLADLVVLRDNPLDDLAHTESVRYVVKNGELFDGETMDSLWPEAQKRRAFFWEIMPDGGTRLR